MKAGTVFPRDPRCMVMSHTSIDSMIDVTPLAPVHFLDPL
jgi:hypothetical protein